MTKIASKILSLIGSLFWTVSLTGCMAYQGRAGSETDVEATATPLSINQEPVNRAVADSVSRGVYPFLYVRVETFDGTVIYEHQVTNPDLAPRIPTGDSWMRLWSMSKSVTIAAILDLEEDGLLNRSDPVTNTIPEFAEMKVLGAGSDGPSCALPPTAPERAMTIEDLLNHTDGLYYAYTQYPCLNNSLAKARLPEARSSADLIDRIAELTLHPSAMTEYHYGIGTTVLGLVAERATNQPLETIIRERITGPLGIDDSLTYSVPPGTTLFPRITGKSGTLKPAAPGDLEIFGGPVPTYSTGPRAFFGGEGMVGTSKAFATVLRMMGNGGALDGVRILDESTVRDWSAPKTQLDSPYGHNGFNIWTTSGKVDGMPDQKPGLLVGGGYEGTAFWIDPDLKLVGLIMSQVHQPVTKGTDEIARLRGAIYDSLLAGGAALE
ncbi:MAG: serine hydrolase domain-containing protein [Pseudomonadota bacterium]